MKVIKFVLAHVFSLVSIIFIRLALSFCSGVDVKSTASEWSGAKRCHCPIVPLGFIGTSIPSHQIVGTWLEYNKSIPIACSKSSPIIMSY